jgi:hypothetical protein
MAVLGGRMQVNVFISAVTSEEKPKLLVLPLGPEAAIPPHLQYLDWRYFATSSADDAIIGGPPGEVEVSLARDGYFLTTPRKPGTPL